MTKSAFKLRSGNASSFKMIGSSPVKSPKHILKGIQLVGKYGKNKGKKISVKDYYQLTWKEKQNYREDRSIRAREYEKLDIASNGYIKGYFPHDFLSHTDFKKSLEREL